MFSNVLSADIHGIEARMIQVEADINDGLPVFSMVGYLSSEVKEAKDRVRVALKNTGYRFPTKRITINLSPADIRKGGTFFDLPIAIALLSSFGFIPCECLKDTLIIGELSLNGKVNAVNGVLPIVFAAKKYGVKRCIIPYENRKEGAVISGIKVIGVSSLKETVEILRGEREEVESRIRIEELFSQQKKLTYKEDFSDIQGQEMAIRAMEIAVAGMHNILLIGPPGTGKTMIAKRIPTIMPNLTLEESLELTKIYSVCGLLNKEESLITERPFRAPHHTITLRALAGGGKNPVPGEITLADRGVLFLDEFAEFNKETIEILRQPLEDGKITISRLNASFQYPSRFLLAAAMNPCNCGYYPDKSKCRCSLIDVKKYLSKISQPILDRIDLCAETVLMDVIAPTKAENHSVKTSEDILNEIMKTRKIQEKRFHKDQILFNGEMTGTMIKKYCKIDVEEEEWLQEIHKMKNFTTRGYHRLLKISRTIADLDESEKILRKHINEALCLRSFDKNYWEGV